MPLPKAVDLIPTDIVDLKIQLAIGPTEAGGVGKEGVYFINVRYSNGDIRRQVGDLLPHLSAADVTWLNDFIDRMLAKAELEML